MKKVDSRFETMDCHAAHAARNDRETPKVEIVFCKKVDSKTTAKDSRICDEKSLLCERVQGRILGVCNRIAHEAIKDLSRKTSEAVQGEAAAGFFSKAESTSETKTESIKRSN